MTDTRISLVVVLGSDRPGRFCDTIASWVLDRIEPEADLSVSVVDPIVHAGMVTHESPTPRARIAATIDRADAFIVVVPEYNHGYPAPLKALIDSIDAPWRAKPVAFVSYGGISGGIRAVEQLRQVFAELHAVGIRDAVSFANASQQFDPQGRLMNPQPAEQAMRRMIAQLRWWAHALRTARGAQTYPQAA